MISGFQNTSAVCGGMRYHIKWYKKTVLKTISLLLQSSDIYKQIKLGIYFSNTLQCDNLPTVLEHYLKFLSVEREPFEMSIYKSSIHCTRLSFQIIA
jgi:hypothetical protein